LPAFSVACLRQAQRGRQATSVTEFAMRPTLRLEGKQKSCAIQVGYLLPVA